MKKVRFNIGFRKVIHRTSPEIPIVPSCNNQLLMSNDGQLECTPMGYDSSRDIFATQSDISLSYTAPNHSTQANINLGGSENRIVTYMDTKGPLYMAETDRFYVVNISEPTDVYLLSSSSRVGRIITVYASAYKVRLLPQGSDKIQGASSYTISSGHGATLLATDKLQWIVIGQ